MDSKTLINRYTIFVFGFGFGILFQLSCVIAGIMKDAFAVVKARIYSFFEDVQISVKYAFEAYLDDIKVNGIVFWIYLSIMILTVVLFVLGLKELMTFIHYPASDVFKGFNYFILIWNKSDISSYFFIFKTSNNFCSFFIGKRNA